MKYICLLVRTAILCFKYISNSDGAMLVLAFADTVYSVLFLIGNSNLCREYFVSFLCFVDRASLYNLVNKANLVHNLLLVYLLISTCFGRLWALHREKQLCLYDTWYLLFCVDDCLVCRVEFHPAYRTVIHTEQQIPRVA